MPLNNLRDWDTSGQLSPYSQGAGQQGMDAIAALLKILQQQQQNKVLRTATGRLMGGEQVPQGVDAGKLYSDLAIEKAKPINASSVLDQIELKNVLEGLKNQGQPPVSKTLAGVLPSTSEMGTPALEQVIPPNSITETGGMGGKPTQFMEVAKGTDKYGNPIKAQEETPEFKLWMKQQEGQIAEKARGIDPMYKKQVEIFKDVLRHRGELEGLLFNQKQFKPGVKSWNPTRKENQRMQELLNEAQTAKKLLSARNVQGEDTSKMSIPGIGHGVRMFANPEAMKANLEDLYTTIQATTENIQPGATQAPVQTPEKRGGVLMVDANGNKALVYPDGTFKEQ